MRINNLILAGLLICVGCVSRREFRDRMDNMADVHSHDWLRLQRQINEQASQIEALQNAEKNNYKSFLDGYEFLSKRCEAIEKKVEECRKPIPFMYDPMPIPPISTDTLKLWDNQAKPERPNWPCPYCDGSAPKP